VPRGIALVAVLWIVGALSVLVTGVVLAQRAELRMAGAARASLVGEAAGQAAIHIVLQRMTAGGDRIDRLTRVAVRHDERDIVVEVMPLTGLIDLNLAPRPLLEAFVARAGGADEKLARQVAEAVVARREAAPGPAEASSLLAAPEELLSLPGVDYDLFARLAPMVTTGSGGVGRINPLAAPDEVLRFLAAGNAALARRVADDRDAGVVAIDTSRLEGAFIDATVSTRHRFTAQVPMADGARVLVVRDVDTAVDSLSPAPWQTFRTSTRWIAAPVAER
jgi:general secretion pathway protein K